MIATEATETEGAEGEKLKALSFLKNRISSLEKMDLGDEKANLIREGVIIAMKTKADELSKADESEDKSSEAKVDETGADKAEDASKQVEDKTAETDTKTDVKGEGAGEEAEEDTEEDDDKTASAEVLNLKKLDDVNKALERIAPSQKTEKLGLEKTVSSCIDTLVECASVQ